MNGASPHVVDLLRNSSTIISRQNYERRNIDVPTRRKEDRIVITSILRPVVNPDGAYDPLPHPAHPHRPEVGDTKGERPPETREPGRDGAVLE